MGIGTKSRVIYRYIVEKPPIYGDLVHAYQIFQAIRRPDHGASIDGECKKGQSLRHR
jgi:hypothetical protein